MEKYFNFAPVQNYIDPNNQDILWYYIPGFNGYEISNIGIIRSMKHHKKYPFGMIIKPKEVNNIIELFTKQFDDLTYELSDNNNKRQIVKVSEIKQLAFSNTHHVKEYPRKTIVTDRSSRNISCFVKRDEPDKSSLNQIHQVQFYQENTNGKINNGELINTKENSQIIKPIIFI